MKGLAVGYCRVSTDEQCGDNKVSLQSQKAKIVAYCTLKDLQLSEIIEDGGFSGKNLRRPGAQKVLSLARRKQIQAIVVYKLDRMFRSTIDALETTKMLERQGVAFHSIEENLDTQSAMGRFFYILTASLAELERRIIGERTKAALAYKRSKNEKTGGDVPYGYEITPQGLLIKNDAEQKVIKLIRHLNRQGATLTEICKEIELAGFLTKRGNKNWHPKTVSRLLKRVNL